MQSRVLVDHYKLWQCYGVFLVIGCASFCVPWCLVSEAPHSGAIPCAMAGQNFHQYNPVYNPPFLNYDFSIEFQFSSIILEDKNRKNALDFPLTDTFYVNFFHWLLL